MNGMSERTDTSSDFSEEASNDTASSSTTSNGNDYFDNQMEGYYSNGGNGIINIMDTSNSNQEEEEEENFDTLMQENIDLSISLQSNRTSSVPSMDELPLANNNNFDDENGIDFLNEMAGEEEDDDGGDDDDDDVDNDSEPQVPLPAARHHTYLPGTTNPLYPEQWLLPSSSSLATATATSAPPIRTNSNIQFTNNNQHSNQTRDDSDRISNANHPLSPTTTTTMILPILQLEGVVIFPNSTLPLRLKHKSWVKYLSRKISFARDGGIGISTTATTSSSNNTIGNETISSRDMQVRIGILTKLQRDNRRRRMLLRRGIYGNRHNGNLEEEEEEEEEEENDDEETNIDSVDSESTRQQYRREQYADDNDAIRDFRMGRWNIQLLRRGVIQHTTNAGNHNADDSNSSTNGTGGGDGGDSLSNASRRNAPLLPIHERFLHPISPSSVTIMDPLVHRIGTLATITYTHEEDNMADDGDNNRTMIVTALTTGRFRIVKRVSEQSNNNRPVNHNECQLYHVEEIIDDNIKQPPIKTNYNLEKKNSELDSENVQNVSKPDIYHKAYRTMIRNVSKVSPLSSCALVKIWPYKLCEDIIFEIASNEALYGLWKSLPVSSGRIVVESSSSERKKEREDINININVIQHKHQNIQYCIDRSKSDPVSFSYWVAANLPLSQSDKLDVLEMNHVERLRFFWGKLMQQRNVIRYIKCKHCGSKIAKLSDLFTVSGAEGTSGAYVNEHGCIHQTVTVKTVQEGSTICLGGAETKDSWFPGYSWTIICCKYCYMHLGWKFKCVTKNRNDLSTFWGLSGSNITSGKWKFGM